MSYVDDVCYALVRVLDHAVVHKDVRLAGYAANLDFWVEEIRHCLDCLAGYERRHARLVEERREFAAKRRIELDPVLTTRTTTDAELRKLELRLTSAAQRFLKLCCEHGYIDHERQQEIEAYLGIRINYSRVLD